MVGKPSKAEEAKSKKFVKAKQSAPNQLKTSGSLPPLKAAENPEAEQLQVFVDEEETEVEPVEQAKVEQKSEFTTTAEQ